MTSATPRQLWALFTGTGLATKGLTNLTLNKATNLISDLRAAENDGDIEKFNSVCAELITLGAKGTPKPSTRMKEKQFKELFKKADEAGMNAVRGFVPTPMIVQEHVSPLDDNSPVKTEYFVPDGVCGFAWIVVKPGTSSFAKWLVKEKLADKHYAGGVCVWVGKFGQSMDRKEKYAYAFAEVLRAASINAYAGSRMD